MRPDEGDDRRLRICFPFSGDSLGGSHVSVRGLLLHLDPARYRAIVVPEVPGGRIAQHFTGQEQISDPGARGLFVPGEAFTPRKFARALLGLWPRMRFLRRHRIAIVHVNDGRTCANWALPARLAGAKLVWHHRGDPHALGLRWLAPLLAHRVLAVSAFALPPPGRWSARRKALVVHSPFDTDLAVDRAAARAALVQELDIAPDALILGFFGAFVPRKRPLLFVDLVARLRATLDRPVVGLMFGEARVPAMEVTLRHRIGHHGVGDRLRLMGHRTPGPFWIAACDQLVVPAVGEPFGRTLVEAMLVGTPVVAARSGGNVEALDGGIGVLVPPDDLSALAQACGRLGADTVAAAAMAQRAGAAARRRFSQAAHAMQVSEIYAQLCPSTVPRRIGTSAPA